MSTCRGTRFCTVATTSDCARCGYPLCVAHWTQTQCGSKGVHRVALDVQPRPLPKAEHPTMRLSPDGRPLPEDCDGIDHSVAGCIATGRCL